MPAVEETYSAFGGEVAQSLGVAFNLRDENVAKDLLQRSNRLKGASDTTWQRVQEALVDGDAEGETITEIAKRIGKVFDQARGYRSRVIARTETVGAMNAGSFRAADQSGVVEDKVWLAARDHRTRSSHVTADGQAVAMDKKFAVGASRMAHPGDPAGGASEVVNCRCSMLFKRTDVPATEELPEAVVPGATPSEARVAAIRTQAEELRKRSKPPAPDLSSGEVTDLAAARREARLKWNVEREAEVRSLGAQVRQEALARAGVVEVDQAAVDALTVRARALMDEAWNLRPEHVGHGVNPVTGEPYPYQIPEGTSRIDARKKLRAKLDKEREGILAERSRLLVAPKEARGKAALEVLREVREMGVDPKAITFQTGSNGPAKAAVQEMSQWFPADWWKSAARQPLQAKTSDGRGYYSANYPEKSKGALRIVERLVTTAKGGDYRSTTVHELGHRMEEYQEDVTRLEMRFWRRRTGDGNGPWTKTVGSTDASTGERVERQVTGQGMKTYTYGKSDEVVNPDEFGDEYMGKSYLARQRREDDTFGKRPPGSPRDRRTGNYIPEDLDNIEGAAEKVESWEVFTMGMEELVFNNYGSWDRDADYIDFMLGLLVGV